MRKMVSENPLVSCRNLQANGAQFFRDTLYILGLFNMRIGRFSAEAPLKTCKNEWK